MKTNVTGREPSPPPATYETEKISAAGFSFLRSTVHLPVAVYWIALRPRPHVAVVSAPVGGSWSGFFSSFSLFVSSLMGGHATDFTYDRVSVRVQGVDEHPAYPVRIEGELEPDLSRWLWVVKWLLAIPHYVVLAFLWLTLLVLSVVAFFAILVTGRYPRGIFDFNVGVLRWTWRVAFYSYGALGTDRYPPFTLDDVADYPARLDVEYPESLSRGLVLVKWWLLAIPHYIVVGIFLGGGSYAAARVDDWFWSVGFQTGLIGILVVFAGFALVFIGSYPRGIFDLVVGLDRWVARVGAYVLLMRDEYPPFRLDQGGIGELSGPRAGNAEHGSRANPRRAPRQRHCRPNRRSSSSASSRASSRSRLLVGGCALVAVDQTQRDDDGFLMSPSQEFASPTYAIVSESADLDTDGAEWALDTFLGTVRDTKRQRSRDQSSSASDRPAEVDRYLEGVEHDVVDRSRLDRRSRVPPRRRRRTRRSSTSALGAETTARRSGSTRSAARASNRSTGSPRTATGASSS